MYYSSQCTFGIGQILLLLQTLINDNRQVTTRSLMTLLSSLLSLSMCDGENCDQFSRHIELFITELTSSGGTLLLFYTLRALPAVSYEPVRHIILVTPEINFSTGMSMLLTRGRTHRQHT